MEFGVNKHEHIFQRQKVHEPAGRVQFVVFEKTVYNLFVFQLCTRVTTLHSLYNFALVSHENALVFSQSEARNIFKCTITDNITLEVERGYKRRGDQVTV